MQKEMNVEKRSRSAHANSLNGLIELSRHRPSRTPGSGPKGKPPNPEQVTGSQHQRHSGRYVKGADRACPLLHYAPEASEKEPSPLPTARYTSPASASAIRSSRNLPDFWNTTTACFAAPLINPKGVPTGQGPGVFGAPAFEGLHLKEAP